MVRVVALRPEELSDMLRRIGERDQLLRFDIAMMRRVRSLASLLQLVRSVDRPVCAHLRHSGTWGRFPRIDMP